MNRKTAWMLAIWLPLAGLAVAQPPAGTGMPAELRQRIVEQLPGEIGTAARRTAKVVASGDLAAVRLRSAVYVLERDAGAGRWRPVARITAAGEAHFGDSMLLGSDTLLVAAPDTAGAGLGPGMAYVFQRNVGGSDRWGLVARLTPAAYPPPGAVEVRQLAPSAEAPSAEAPSAEAPSAEAETVVADGPAVEEAAAEPAVEEAVAEAPPPTVAEPAIAADLRFIVIANMREKPRALALAASLRDQDYPSEVYRNDRGFFIVTLAHLPRVEARRVREEAVAAGDIPADSYLIIGAAFRERISP